MNLLCSRLLLLLIAIGGIPTAPAGELIHSTDHFKFTYRVELPQVAHEARLWLPIAQTNRFQEVKVEELSTPVPARRITDRSGLNQILFLILNPAEGRQVVEIRYDVIRREKASYTDEADPSLYLQPNRLVPRNEIFAAAAREAFVEKGAALTPGRALYDYVRHRMKYDKSQPGIGRGDAVHASEVCAGNCTDFHSYFMALAHSVGIPVRFAIGASIPADRNEGAVASYHCWIDFFENGRWVPVEISEAAKHPELAEYYFGHQPANRFELSCGRDLQLDPAPSSGPINFLVYPLLEVDGVPTKVDTEFAFQRITD